MFSEVFGKVLFSWAPIYDDVLLLDAILHVVKVHAHHFWFLLILISVYDAGSVRMTYLGWSSWLWVSHFGKCDSERYAIFNIVEESNAF